MNETDPRSAERSFYDDTDYADIDLQPAEDVTVNRRPAPRSTFALRLDASTIDQLRELAREHGTRPTQLAREWLTERLERERRETHRGDAEGSSAHRLDDRVARLERAFVQLAGSSAHATTVATSTDADLVDELEAQAFVARQLRRRLDAAVTVEAATGPGADLVVRSGRRSWVVEFKSGGSVDLAPTFRRLRALAEQMDARPVLVSPRLPSDEVEPLSRSSGVLVTRPDDLEVLLAEIATADR